MSTIIATTVQAGTIQTSAGKEVTLTRQSANKSWVNYNMGGTPAARDSFNHSSITDNAAGDGSLNFTNVFLAANYAFAGASSVNDSANDANIGIIGPRRVTDTGITTAFARMHHIYLSLIHI